MKKSMQQQAHIDIQFFKAQTKTFGKCIKVFKEEQLQSSEHVVLSGYPYDNSKTQRVGCTNSTLFFRNNLVSYDIYQKSGCKIFDSGDIHRDLSVQDRRRALYQKHKQLLKTHPKRIIMSIGGGQQQILSNLQALIQIEKGSKNCFISISKKWILKQNQDFVNQISPVCDFILFGADTQLYQVSNLKNIWQISFKDHIRQNQTQSSKIQAAQVFKKMIQQSINRYDSVYVSVDISSVGGQWIPGTSNPNVGQSLSNSEFLSICRLIGSIKCLRIVDFSQFNPSVESITTSNLLVEGFYEICQGIGSKKK